MCLFQIENCEARYVDVVNAVSIHSGLLFVSTLWTTLLSALSVQCMTKMPRAKPSVGIFVLCIKCSTVTAYSLGCCNDHFIMLNKVLSIVRAMVSCSCFKLLSYFLLLTAAVKMETNEYC